MMSSAPSAYACIPYEPGRAQILNKTGPREEFDEGFPYGGRIVLVVGLEEIGNCAELFPAVAD
jgi:hypothetical protein